MNRQIHNVRSFCVAYCGGTIGDAEKCYTDCTRWNVDIIAKEIRIAKDEHHDFDASMSKEWNSSRGLKVEIRESQFYHKAGELMRQMTIVEERLISGLVFHGDMKRSTSPLDWEREAPDTIPTIEWR